jgi:hypothetical protein
MESGEVHSDEEFQTLLFGILLALSTMPVHGIWHWVVYDAKVLFIERLVKN